VSHRLESQIGALKCNSAAQMNRACAKARTLSFLTKTQARLPKRFYRESIILGILRVVRSAM